MHSTAIDTFTRQTASTFITAYQKYLSPHKGFSCAYRVLHRGESCSQYIKQVVMEQGLGDALPLIRQRFHDCKVANKILRERRAQRQFAIQDGEDFPDLGPDSGNDEAGSPEGDRRKRFMGGSFRRRAAANAGSTNGGNGCTDLSCDGLDCADIGCSGLDCAATDCGALDCSALDCSGMDCSGMDCSGADCSGCDFGSCS